MVGANGSIYFGCVRKNVYIHRALRTYIFIEAVCKREKYLLRQKDILTLLSVGRGLGWKGI